LRGVVRDGILTLGGFAAEASRSEKSDRVYGDRGARPPVRTSTSEETAMEKIWLKHYYRGVPAAMTFEDITLPAALARTASRFPDNRALMFQGTVVTFRELDDMASRFAGALAGLGVNPGDRVSIILPNLIQTAVAIYGALRAGAVVVMHNPRNDDMLLEYQFRDAGPETVICLDVLVPRVIALKRKTRIKTIISCHIRDYLPFLKKQLFPLVKRQLHLKTPDEADVLEFTEVIEAHGQLAGSRKISLEDTAFFLYTSATTGKSKGVELTHANVSRNTQQLRAWFPSFRDGIEIVIGCLPFFHVFGLTCALNIGIFYGFGDVLIPLPEPKSILEGIHDYKATFIPTLPTIYTAIINDPALKKYDLKSVKGCFSGGAPLPLETIRQFEKMTGAQICEGYGLTETSPVTHLNPFGGKTKVGTIGLPLPNTEAKIVDVDDPTVEITTPGQPGELSIRGPQVMRGYVNLPEKTQAVLQDGWLLTGDIVTVDSEGYFTVVDRKKDLIVHRGQKIYPRDVDEVLFSHPKVKEACCIGVPDSSTGQAVKAFVVLRKGERCSQVEIVDYCRRHLAPHQVPKVVDFLEDLPRSPVGKILRKELKRIHLVRSAGVGVKKDSQAG